MVWLSVAITAAAALLLMPVLVRAAVRLDLLDHPGGRKAHQGAVPLVGGLAMFLAFVFGLLSLPEGLGSMRALVAGAALLVVVGVLDDMSELSSSSRFMAQIIASLLMVFWADVSLLDLGHLTGERLVTLGLWSIPLTVFAVVGVINALNMIDGVDGLAGSVGLVSALALALLAAISGNTLAMHVLLLLSAAIAVFLNFNLRLPWQARARVFMGDAGSMFLGFVLGWFLVQLSQGEAAAFSPAVALWLFGLPLIDTVTMMLRRVARGRSPFAADREHFHHVLLMAGFSPNVTLAVMVAAAVLMAMVGIIGQLVGVPESVMFYAFLVVFAGYFYMILRSWRVMRFLRRSINRRQPGRDRRSGSDRRCATDANYPGPERRSGVDRRQPGRDRRRSA